MEELIKREDAIKAIAEYFSDDDDGHWNAIATYIIKDIPSAEPKPVLTEEVREAIMRLTMCARHECAICKLSNNEDDCYEITTKMMHILVDAFAEQKQGEWICEMTKRQEPDRWVIERVALYCSECNGEAVKMTKFCPNCGCRMEGVDDE